MNNKQYNNVIEKTAKLSETDMNDSLALTRDTLNNMGVPLPQGELKEVSEILSTNDYMYWRACTAEEAQQFANKGIATIAVGDTDIMVVAAIDSDEGIGATAYSERSVCMEADQYNYYTYCASSSTSIDQSGTTSTTTTIYPPIETYEGIYYFNNKEHGTYLRRLFSNAEAKSGTFDGLIKETIQWELTLYDGYYTIKAVYGSNKYLAVPNANDSDEVILMTVSSIIPDTCKWKIRVASGGGTTIQNVVNNRYLAYHESRLCTLDSIDPTATALYHECVWRKISSLTYGNENNFKYCELNSFDIEFSGFSVGDILIPKIKHAPENAAWIRPTDFIFTSEDTDYVAINNSTCAIIAKDSGTVNITATHKITGISKDFELTISGLSTRGNYGSVKYNNKVYKIVFPSCSNDLYGWTLEDVVVGDDIRYDWDIFRFFAGYQADDLGGVANGENVSNIRADEMKKASIFGLVLGIPEAISSSVEVDQIFYRFEFYEKNDLRLVTIQIGSHKVQELYDTYADGRSYSYAMGPNCEVTTPAFARRSSQVGRYYERLTGESIGIFDTYDIVLTADTKHKDDIYSSYLWVNSNGEFMEKPFVYEDDSAQLGRRHGFLYLNFTPYLDLPIDKSMKAADYYQEMLSTAVAQDGIIIG